MAVPGVEVLVVDGANVVGARPDGWWKDRAGAAGRLHGRLLSAPELATSVVLVLEGRARAGVPEGATGAVRVVHAARSGDDAIVAEAERAAASGASVGVVTADRELSARVQRVGAAALRPSWLLDRLDGVD